MTVERGTPTKPPGYASELPIFNHTVQHNYLAKENFGYLKGTFNELKLEKSRYY